jgi:4-nitrophenyl phosphatase
MNEDKKKLSDIKCFLFDMDGTIYLGDQVLPGALELISYLTKKESPFLFLSNNSSKNERVYFEKLIRLGFRINQDHIFTSGQATAAYLKEHFSQSRFFVLGTESLKETFSNIGLILEEQDPDVAVLGFDTTITYQKLWRFCDLIRAGLPYIATHPDINCPTESGFMPDIGSTISFIAASTGRHPDVIFGKPNPAMADAIRNRTHIPLKSTAMIGDRLYTDIAMGDEGFITILVLTGETKIEDLQSSQFHPDFIYENLAELFEDMSKDHNQE